MPKKLDWMREICKRGGLWALCRKLTIPGNVLSARFCKLFHISLVFYGNQLSERSL